jgi:hypothetical protein
VSVVESYSPDETGETVELRIDSTYTGLRAQSMRTQINSQGVDTVARNYANFYRKRYSDLTVADPIRIEDTPDADRLVIREHYSLANAWSVRSGRDRGLDVFPDALNPDAQLPAITQRTTPLALSHPSTLRHRIVVTLPQGWHAAELPAKAEVSGPHFRYQRTASKGQDRLELEHQFEVLVDHVPPESLGQYVRGIREVGDDLDVRINLQVGAPKADAERTERLQRLLREAMDKKKENQK